MCVSILLMAGWFLARGSDGNFADLFCFRILEEMSDGNFAGFFLFRIPERNSWNQNFLMAVGF